MFHKIFYYFNYIAVYKIRPCGIYQHKRIFRLLSMILR